MRNFINGRPAAGALCALALSFVMVQPVTGQQPTATDPALSTVALAEQQAAPPRAADRQTLEIVAPPDRDGNEANQRANLAQRQVASRAQEIETLLLEVKQRVKDFEATAGGGKDVLKEKLALQSFRILIPRLRDEATWLLDKKTELDGLGQAYLESLSGAEQALKALAPVWARFAASEQDANLRETYAGTSKHFQGLAAEMDRRAKAFQGSKKTVEEKLAFIARSRVLLSRLEGVITILENPAGRGAEVEVYLRQIDSYLKNFEQAVKSFQDLSKSIQAPPLTPTQPPSRGPIGFNEVPASTPANSIALTIASRSFKRDVVVARVD